jgi:hypothetical protein
MTMLEYHKMILDKVKTYPSIFNKELRKALKQSSKEEFEQLKQWYKDKFRSNKDQLKYT